MSKSVLHNRIPLSFFLAAKDAVFGEGAVEGEGATGVEEPVGIEVVLERLVDVVLRGADGFLKEGREELADAVMVREVMASRMV